MDSHDKLKPYGIYGCIDGFNHHIMWMEAHHSDPKVTRLLHKHIAHIGGCLQQIQVNAGKENGNVVYYYDFILKILKHFSRNIKTLFS